ncbi:MAG TPA: hydrogenase nickel incorporation protein HypB [Aquabacterium sp.]|nr:hydrogenase nickel incorporation protein HypB [Aquabacterium sp.]
MHEHAPAGLQTRLVQLEQDILAGNNHVAQHVREHLTQQHTLALNLVSSPGSGKTTLLVETIRRLSPHRPVAVIEGDQQTSLDAERIRATGAPAIQINTGKGCHLDARMVHDALHHLPALPQGVLLIENVGNLVCPASFDLGEAHKVLLFSITEGEDKPLKYPDMFQAADLIILSKYDLLPHLAFDVDKAMGCIRQVNPQAEVIRLSATHGAGMDAWLSWIERECAAT